MANIQLPGFIDVTVIVTMTDFRTDVIKIVFMFIFHKKKSSAAPD